MNSRILKRYRSKYSALICLNLVFGLHSIMCSAQHSHESGQKPADLSSRCALTAPRSCKVSSLTVDAAGHLWIAVNGCVFKAEGGGLRPLVELPPLPENNSSMTGITAGSAGEIYMADSEGNKVVKVSPTATLQSLREREPVAFRVIRDQRQTLNFPDLIPWRWIVREICTSEIREMAASAKFCVTERSQL